MSHSRVVVVHVEEDGQRTELTHVDFPAEDVAALPAETVLDHLEATTQETGNAVLRQVLQARWGMSDAAVTEGWHPGRVRTPGREVSAHKRWGTWWRWDS